MPRHRQCPTDGPPAHPPQGRGSLLSPAASPQVRPGLTKQLICRGRSRQEANDPPDPQARRGAWGPPCCPRGWISAPPRHRSPCRATQGLCLPPQSPGEGSRWPCASVSRSPGPQHRRGSPEMPPRPVAVLAWAPSQTRGSAHSQCPGPPGGAPPQLAPVPSRHHTSLTRACCRMAWACDS